MAALIATYNRLYDFGVNIIQHLDGVASLALRLFLAPVMLASGWEKLTGDNWFGGMTDSFPFPFSLLSADLNWFLATWTEFGGGLLLLLGLGVRWISVPLMVTMFVAAYSVHWDNGWPAIAPSRPAAICYQDSVEARDAGAFDKFISCYNVSERTIAASERLARGKAIMRNNGNWNWLNSNGSFAKLNNGIEFAVSYFVMLLALLIIGGGRYFSLDYWLGRSFKSG